jgi:predicted O-methyltransferase YrrM
LTLAQAYTTELGRDSDIVEHLPTFVDVVHALKATTVIELGVRGGVSTTAWLYAVADTGGHVWSVDVDPTPAHGTFADTGRWTFILGDDCSPEVLAQLPRSADVVFIDTSHAYDHTYRELAAYVPRVRPGGLVLLHDTEVLAPDNIGPQVPFPVKEAVRDFCAVWQLPWSNDPRCNGLATIPIPERG